MFLHSYQTTIRDPSDDQWRSAISPLPEDLGELLGELELRNRSHLGPYFSRKELALPMFQRGQGVLKLVEGPEDAQKLREVARRERVSCIEKVFFWLVTLSKDRE